MRFHVTLYTLHRPACLTILGKYIMYLHSVIAPNRPRKLLVIVNPISGSGNAMKVYKNTAAGIFKDANIETSVIGKNRTYLHKSIQETTFANKKKSGIKLVSYFIFISSAYVLYLWIVFNVANKVLVIFPHAYILPVSYLAYFVYK